MTDQEKPKEPGLFTKINTYIKKNQEANRRAGDKPLSEEISSFGAEWGKNFSKGMAEVGNSEEAKLSGGKAKIVHDDDGLMDEILFGKKPGKKTVPQSDTSEVIRKTTTQSDEIFIQRLCEFLRYVNEDDDVELYQHRGTHFMKADYKYLSKLLTRYLGYKVTLKERDLMIK